MIFVRLQTADVFSRDTGIQRSNSFFLSSDRLIKPAGFGIRGSQCVQKIGSRVQFYGFVCHSHSFFTVPIASIRTGGGYPCDFINGFRIVRINIQSTRMICNGFAAVSFAEPSVAPATKSISLKRVYLYGAREISYGPIIVFLVKPCPPAAENGFKIPGVDLCGTSEISNCTVIIFL